MSTNKEEKIPIKLTLSYFYDDIGSGLEYTVDPFYLDALKIYGKRVIHYLNLNSNIYSVELNDRFRVHFPNVNMSHDELLNKAEEAADNFRSIYGYPGRRSEEFVLTIIKK